MQSSKIEDFSEAVQCSQLRILGHSKFMIYKNCSRREVIQILTNNVLIILQGIWRRHTSSHGEKWLVSSSGKLSQYTMRKKNVLLLRSNNLCVVFSKGGVKSSKKHQYKDCGQTWHFVNSVRCTKLLSGKFRIVFYVLNMDPFEPCIPIPF